MRLSLKQLPARGHADLVSGAAWAGGELWTCSDDHSVVRWSAASDLEGKVCVFEDTCFTDLQWLPGNAWRQHGGAAAAAGASGNDLCALACTDGTVKLVTRAGRVDKSFEAHQGAVLALRWAPDGSALATAGEDGQVKVWSRAGMLRCTLAQADAPVHALAWGRDGGAVAFCSGGGVAVKPLHGSGGGAGGSGPPGRGSGAAAGRAAAGGSSTSGGAAAWKAHDGSVLALDWSPVNGLLVTAGEDCRYKVWDPYGRLLYASTPCDNALCSAAWAPGGEMFAVGGFNCISLCDAAGWAHAKAHAELGSVLRLAWAPDGTQLAAAGGAGAAAVGRIVGRRAEGGAAAAVLEDERTIRVADAAGEVKETLELRDPVVKFSLGHGHLVAATATQCYIYSTSNFNTPHIVDLAQPPHLLLQCERCMLLVDAAAGMQILTYDGRPVCQPKAPGLRPELLSPSMVSLAPDTLAALDAPGGAAVRLFDTAQGRQQGEPLRHGVEVRQVALSQAPGTSAERLLALVDANRDLHLVHPATRATAKLASGVDAAAWHDASPQLAAVVDGCLVIWHHPGAAFGDPELLEAARSVRGESRYEASARVTGFCGGSIQITRADGAAVSAWAPPHAATLHALARRREWRGAARLCRATRERGLWAALAALAMAAGELPAAEVAFAALGMADRLAFVQRLAAMGCPERRAAELAVYRRRPEEAEALLLQARLVYRAVKLHARLHNWGRALELAQRHAGGRHVPALLLLRARDLARRGGHKEGLEAYRRAAAETGAIDEAAARAGVAEEKRREAELAAATGAKAGGAGKGAAAAAGV